MEEGAAVLGVGAAVDLEHERIALRRVEVGRLEQPAMHLGSVRRRGRALLRLREPERREEFLVQGCEPAPLRALAGAGDAAEIEVAGLERAALEDRHLLAGSVC